MTNAELLFILFLLFVLFLVICVAGYLLYELFQTRKRLARFKGITNLEAEQKKVKSKTNILKKTNKRLETEQAKLKEERTVIESSITNLKQELKQLQDETGLINSISELREQLTSLEDEANIQEYGLYEPKYDFEESERYKRELDTIRQKQKQMIRNKEAIIWATKWEVQGSASEGRKMMNQNTKLMLRAFNGECDALILKVKYNNINNIEKRLNTLHEALNKLGKSNNCWISQDYFNLKLQELYLVHEYQEKKQAEREEQRRIREQMREEERAQRELEKAKIEAEREEARYQKALKQAQKEMEKATGAKHEKLQGEIENLTRLLQEAHEKRERAKSRAEMTRSGYVYVVSNIGSFGEDIYKIGMTRRLEPMDRVKELGDASVPFPFDVHALIFSEDAPTLENTLHNQFGHRRVNRVNERKEFFEVGLREIAEFVHNNHGEIEFTLKAEAEEFRKTQAIMSQENKRQIPVPVAV